MRDDPSDDVAAARRFLVQALFNINDFGVLPDNRGAALANAAAAVVILAKDARARGRAAELVQDVIDSRGRHA